MMDYGAVSFEAFINLLVDITEDQTTPEQLREAFRGIAGDKVCIGIALKRLQRF
jgi:Ca2+-binding EF-hand superfamily protein